MIYDKINELKCTASTVAPGDVKVSTGARKRDKRAVVCSVYVKKGTLKINGNTKNDLAIAA